MFTEITKTPRAGEMLVDRVWLDEYEKGIPHEIEPDSYASLNVLLEEAFSSFSDRCAVTNMGVSCSYRELQEKITDMSAFFQEEWNLQKGDRLAIMLPNVTQYFVVLFAALRVGAVVVNINPLYTATELHNILQDSDAKAIIVLDHFVHVVQEAQVNTALKHVCVTRLGDMLGPKGHLVNFVVKYVKKMVPAWTLPGAITFPQALKIGKKKTFSPVDVTGQDLAFLQYTGGTTGGPKGAKLTHRNMVANVLQARAWLQDLPARYAGQGGIVTPLPLYHIFSLTANCFTFFTLGVYNVLVTNPRDIPGFVKILKRENFIAMTGVNTLFNALLNNPDFVRLDFSKFQMTLGGGMAVQSSVAERWHEVTGAVLLEAYGLTETSPAVCINPLSLKAYNGSIGLPISSTDIVILDEENNSLPLGEIGEICVQGPQVMAGYWNKPEETAYALRGGWFHTGDMGLMEPNGLVRIVDRIKDMIIISGFNVYPNEVEDVLVQHEGVLECAVIGIPNEKCGEMVKAFVVRKTHNLNEADLVTHCRQKLTAYKVPKLIEFREELPKTNVGKVLRRALRDEAILKSDGLMDK